MTTPTTQAHVAFDPSRFGVLIQIRTGQALRAFDDSGVVLIPQDNSRLADDDAERKRVDRLIEAVIKDRP